MIDLTPLDVRNKRGDFKKLMRGYDPQEVDVFLELVAERLEALVRENIQLRDRTAALQEQVEAQAGREQAVQDALVTAQELRKDIREQSQREADHIMREAESEARRMIAEAEAEVRSRLRGIERQMDQSRDSLQELERRRQRFLQEFRGLLQRELDVVEVEEERVPLEDRTVDLDLGSRRGASPATTTAAAGAGLTEVDLQEESAAQDTMDVASTEAPDADAPGADVGSAQAPESDTSDADVASTEAPDAAAPSADVGSAQAPESAPLGAGVVSAEVPSAEGTAADDSAIDKHGAHEDAAAPALSVTVPQSSDGTRDGPTAVVGADEAPVDIEDLQPEDGQASTTSPPPLPSVGGEPSSLELELMAGVSDGPADGPPQDYPEVPDLETVLAEAGIDDVGPQAEQEISPPPASHKPVDDDDRRPEDRLALFDKDKKGKKG